jgi:hypothetical protein
MVPPILMTRVGVYPKNKRPRNGRLRALLTPCKISLFLPEISLLSKIFSLLICVGNLPKSGCSTGVFRTDITSKIPKIVKFPVNFPDSREHHQQAIFALIYHDFFLDLSQ